jgi:hypothetical protein
MTTTRGDDDDEGDDDYEGDDGDDDTEDEDSNLKFLNILDPNFHLNSIHTSIERTFPYRSKL